MKIALCFSGQPRFIEECYPKINKNLLQCNANHEIDIFVHTWHSPEMCDSPLYCNEMSSFSGEATIKCDAIDLIKKIYNPKLMFTEPPLKFKNDSIEFEESLNKYFAGHINSKLSKKEFRDIKINNIYSMFYSILKSNMLKKQIELSNDFIYDVVVRCRFDLILNSPIIFGSGYDTSFIHYFELNQPDKMISDWFNFSSSKNMDIYSSIYLTIDSLIDKTMKKYNAFSNESLIRTICDVYNIGSLSHNFNIALPAHGKI